MQMHTELSKIADTLESFNEGRGAILDAEELFDYLTEAEEKVRYVAEILKTYKV